MQRKIYLLKELKKIKKQLMKLKKEEKRLDDKVCCEKTIVALILNKPTGREYYEKTKELKLLKNLYINRLNLIEEELKNHPRKIVLKTKKNKTWITKELKNE